MKIAEIKSTVMTLFKNSFTYSKLYARQIVLPVDAGNDLKNAVSDAADLLERITGAIFKTSVDGTSGILLVRSNSSLAPADAVAKLKGNGREPFLIRSDGKKVLFIVANADDGLHHGLYYYLEQLGVRFYFPSEKWTILPKKTDVTLKIDRLIAPDFKLRDFFGTGGFGPALPLDPNKQIQARWDKWKKRNRFGGEFRLQGHSGEAFNIAKKTILLEHPEYLAKVDGEHVPWSPGAKLNTANSAAVRLYVEWCLERFRAYRKAAPDSSISFAVSVDPADGAGHCNSDECKAIGDGSPSDQVFYVANQVAKAIRAEFSDGWVSLYGYNEHAMPPSIPLEPNVYVMVIPYAFQTTGLTPDEFIKAWWRKVSRMSLYDYWNIPDWSFDQPTFDFRNMSRDKLRYWRTENIEGLLIESTYSSGAMGLAWYVASRMMWDVNTNPKPIVQEFYQKAFGKASVPMARMLDRWAQGFLLTEHELSLSYHDVQEAVELTENDPAIRARIADYGRYLEYLRLHLSFDRAEPAMKVAATDTLVRQIWSIYDSSMVHTFRLFQLLAPGRQDLHDAYNFNEKDAIGWKSIVTRSDDEVLFGVAEGLRTLVPLDFKQHRFGGVFVPLPADDFAQMPMPDKAPEVHLLGYSVLEFDCPPNLNVITFKFSPQKLSRAQVVDAVGEIIWEQRIEVENWRDEWREINIPIPAPGRYQIRLLAIKNDHFSFQPPSSLPLAISSFRTSKFLSSPRVYFYVPRGLRKLAVYQPLPLPENMGIRFFDATGKAATATVHEGRRIYIVPVPPDHDGQVWAMENVIAPNYSIQLLNAPNAFAFFPDTLLVPSDALSS